MRDNCEVLCAGIVVADHICTPISHLPAAGELVLADRLLLTTGGCAARGLALPVCTPARASTQARH